MKYPWKDGQKDARHFAIRIVLLSGSSPLKRKKNEVSPFYVKKSNSYIITLCIFLKEIIMRNSFKKKESTWANMFNYVYSFVQQGTLQNFDQYYIFRQFSPTLGRWILYWVTKLKHYGIEGKVNNWIESFLSGRTQGYQDISGPGHLGTEHMRHLGILYWTSRYWKFGTGDLGTGNFGTE
jgi:hypothetical protein